MDENPQTRVAPPLQPIGIRVGHGGRGNGIGRLEVRRGKPEAKQQELFHRIRQQQVIMGSQADGVLVIFEANQASGVFNIKLAKKN